LSVIDASDCETGNIIEPCHDGSLMLIPLVGPFFSCQSIDTQLALAGPQILGALLAVAGIFHYTSGPAHVRERASLVVDPVPAASWRHVARNTHVLTAPRARPLAPAAKGCTA
jgi:hypothetical protein